MTRGWRDAALGTPREVELPHGRTRYFDIGTGPNIVFVQGWMVNANHWRKVVPLLCDAFRCITVDWPTGSHQIPLREDADLTPPGCAQQIADFLDTLDLSDVTLVGNDSGGALSQIAAANHPARISRLVLSGCETPEDTWPPPQFSFLKQAAQEPDGLTPLFSALADTAVRSTPAAYGLLATRTIDDAVTDTYVAPFLTDAGIRHDLHKIIRGASETYVRDAARTLVEKFEQPILFAWPSDDPVFPLAHAHRYAASLPNARVEAIAGSLSFTPEDAQPERLAELVRDFYLETAKSAVEVGRE